ncbi:hypothetical protein [Marilutibacter chinensis]|uniref:Uncharacterized protein n=1 Tax=Marilutibacter chinensis TaxID=2912247 RepID=A0ABS9HTT8_9GAMM|nr:hypothetical protein [Lysobacter chinensis]MCF7222316.1 hypothetical protein [Lysobacter chinensis]
MNIQLDRNFDSLAANADAAFPFRLHWSADQLAAAVPLRLHQLFEIDDAGDVLRRSANQAPQAHRPRATSYLPDSRMPELFRVR